MRGAMGLSGAATGLMASGRVGRGNRRRKEKAPPGRTGRGLIRPECGLGGVVLAEPPAGDERRGRGAEQQDHRRRRHPGAAGRARRGAAARRAGALPELDELLLDEDELEPLVLLLPEVLPEEPKLDDPPVAPELVDEVLVDAPELVELVELDVPFELELELPRLDCRGWTSRGWTIHGSTSRGSKNRGSLNRG